MMIHAMYPGEDNQCVQERMVHVIFTGDDGLGYVTLSMIYVVCPDEDNS